MASVADVTQGGAGLRVATRLSMSIEAKLCAGLRKISESSRGFSIGSVGHGTERSSISLWRNRTGVAQILSNPQRINSSIVRRFTVRFDSPAVWAGGFQWVAWFQQGDPIPPIPPIPFLKCPAATGVSGLARDDSRNYPSSYERTKMALSILIGVFVRPVGDGIQK